MKISSIVAVFLGAFALFSGQTMAGQTILPGSACVKWNSTDPEPSLSSSEIRNPSSSRWLRLDCPVVRTDFDGFLHDAGVEGSWVRVVDKHYSGNARCRLVSYSHNTNGTTSYWATSTRYSAGSGNHAQVLNTGSLNGENGASHLYFSCHIPPAYSGNYSSLATYYVNQ